MPSAEGVRDLLAPHLMGRLNDGSAELDVVGLEVLEHGRRFMVIFVLTAHGQRWRVRLEGDSSEMAIFDGHPPHDVVRSVASAFRIRLFEWWHMKGSERQLAKLGERIE
ncbi:hypothetical protein [Streptomyces sp. NPDC087300]|uniref:hypothetical protein n=1 Tax=Streptomyces sp. NPDC087300 TaxID=3365780 RepID=UPI003814FAE3